MTNSTDSEIEKILQETFRQIPVSSAKPFYDVEDLIYAKQSGSEQAKHLVVLWKLAWWRSTVCFDLRLEIQRRLRRAIDSAGSVLSELGYSATDLRHVKAKYLTEVLKKLFIATQAAGRLKLEQWRAFCEKMKNYLPGQYQNEITEFRVFLDDAASAARSPAERLVSITKTIPSGVFLEDIRELNSIQFLTCSQTRLKMVEHNLFQRFNLDLKVQNNKVVSSTHPELAKLMNRNDCVPMRIIAKTVHGSLKDNESSAAKESD